MCHECIVTLKKNHRCADYKIRVYACIVCDVFICTTCGSPMPDKCIECKNLVCKTCHVPCECGNTDIFCKNCSSESPNKCQCGTILCSHFYESFMNDIECQELLNCNCDICQIVNYPRCEKCWHNPVW